LDKDIEEQKRKKWLRMHLPARPIQGFLDDIDCTLRAVGERILGHREAPKEPPQEPATEEGGQPVPATGPLSPAQEAIGLGVGGKGPGKAKEETKEESNDNPPGGNKGGGDGPGDEEQDEHRPHQIVWSDQFAKAVRRAGVKVVVLSTCESGWRDYEDFSWSGVAAALLRAGIPVVVGMQFTISDAAAIAFSGAFYRAIARGLSVDEAVGHGRAAMTDEALSDLDEGLDDGLVPNPAGEADNFLSDFGLPVLYTRSPRAQALDKIRDVDTDPLPMTDRFRGWNPGFDLFVGRGRGGE